MLVLSRKVNEQVQIGDNVFLKIIDVGGGRVRLAFDAPTDVRIKRTETTDANPLTLGTIMESRRARVNQCSEAARATSDLVMTR